MIALSQEVICVFGLNIVIRFNYAFISIVAENKQLYSYINIYVISYCCILNNFVNQGCNFVKITKIRNVNKALV